MLDEFTKPGNAAEGVANQHPVEQRRSGCPPTGQSLHIALG